MKRKKRNDNPIQPGLFAKTGTLADDVHRAWHWHVSLEEEICNKVCIAIVGHDCVKDPDAMPFEDLSTDHYDNSVKLIDCNFSTLTSDQIKDIKALGFDKIIIQLSDQTRIRF